MNLAYIVLAYISLFALSFLDNGRSASYPEILKHFNISTDMGSYIFSLASISGLVANITGKYWMGPLGLINGTRTSLVLMGLGGLGIWFGAFFGSYAVVLGAILVMGLGLGVLAITMNILVSVGAPIDSRRRYLSGLHGVYGVSSFIAPQALSLIIFLGGDWPKLFLVSAVLCLLILIFSFKVEDQHKEELKDSAPSFDVPLLKRLPIGLFIGLYVASEVLISSRIPLFLTKGRGMSLSEANNYLSYFFIFLMSGRLGFAFINFKHENNFLLFLSLISSLVTFLLGYYVHPIFLSMTGLTMSFFFPVSIDWITENFPKRNHLMIASVMTMIGVVLTIMHWGFGQLSEIYGVEKSMLIFLFFNIGSLILFLVSKKMVWLIRNES